MKRFFEIVVVALVFALVANTATAGGYHHHHGHIGPGEVVIGALAIGTAAAVMSSAVRTDVTVQRSWGSVSFSSGPVQYYSSPVVYTPVVVSSGHWEQRIVGYRTVMVPRYFPPIYGTYWDGYSFIQYVVRPGRTELVPQQQPIYQQVWISYP